ncbi:MAG: response regulator [Thermodesulfobacteriota bacterium]
MKTVLTIDDSRVVRTTVARALAPWGCQILEARNGLEGLAVARRSQPDLIVLDVLMPVLDGRQTLAELRRDPACSGIPVIMLTAVTGEHLVEECSHLGIAGFLVKPFTMASFDEVVGRVLGPAGALALASRTLPAALAAH